MVKQNILPQICFDYFHEAAIVYEVVRNEAGTIVDWFFIEANRSALQALDYKREALIGKTASALFGVEFVEQLSSNFLRILAGEQLGQQVACFRERYYLVSMFLIDESTLAVLADDVTERKQTEEALRESEDRFRTMADGTPVSIWVTNAAGEMEFVNSAYCDYFGVTLEQVHSGGWQMLVHPDDYASYVDVYMECLREKRPFHAQTRVRRNDDQWHWIESYGQPRFSPTGEFLGMAGSSPDITDRKQAEEMLQAALSQVENEKNRLLAVMEALPTGLAIYDRQGGVFQVNQAYEALWGSPRPPAKTIEDFDLYKAWWADTGLRVQAEEWAAARAVQKGETVAGQFLYIQRFDGTHGYVLNSGAPIRNAQGEITGSAVSVMDITELIEVENALRESQERFRVALASVPLLVYTCDRDQRYTWVYNPLNDYRSEDIVGKRDDEILPPEACIELNEARQHALDTGKADVREVKVPFAGEYNYYILTMEPIKDQKGNVLGLTCSAMDITEQKRLVIQQENQALQMEVQRRLMEYRELERQGIARDLHDGPIQTLASTGFNIQFIKEAYQDATLRVELEQIAYNVKTTIRELREIVNDLRPPSLIRFGLKSAVQMHAEDLHERYPQVRIALDMAEDHNTLSEQACLTLFRIIQEALNNAIRHSGAMRIVVTYRTEQEEFFLELRDNGSGFVVAADLADLTSDGHYGLVGMKERAQTIGATFSIFSEPGKGTSVIVRGSLAGRNKK